MGSIGSCWVWLQAGLGSGAHTSSAGPLGAYPPPPPHLVWEEGKGGWLLEADWIRRPVGHPACESPWKFPSLLWASLCHKEDETVSHPLGSPLQLGCQF